MAADSRLHDVIQFYHLPNPSSSTSPWVLFSHQQKWVLQMEIIIVLCCRVLPVRDADNFPATREPIVWTMWDAQ
jgi:hypothetical protein